MVEIPIVNVDLNVDKLKPENLVWGDNYNKKKDKNHIYKILAYLAIIAALIIFFRFALLAYLYIANLPKINSFDANIERIALTDDGKQAYIKLTGGNQKEIDSIKFVFRSNESEYVYETRDGIKEITYEDKRFLSYFAHPEYEGSYDYVINAVDIGLVSFRDINKVEVLIKYKDEKSGEIKETKIVDSTKKSDINVVRSGGYSGGGGGGGSGSSGGGSGTSGNEPNPTCTPTKTCLNYANLCGSRMSDGCNNILDCSNNCKSGEKCLSGSCVSNEIELPETFEVPYILPTGGKTWYINDTGNINTNGINFQNALINASLGDVIVLQAGVTYYGNFRLPNKTGSGWIYIISSDISSLKEGNRVSPSESVYMPKISAYPDGTNCYTAMINEWGAHNYRFSGIEFVTDGCVYNLILLGYNYFRINEPIWNITSPGHVADTIEKLPYNITFDRCYLHSTNESARSRTGIMLDGRYMAVIDSYLSNFKDRSDSQAINVYSGTGPYKIVNNYLESTGENFMSGGTDPNILNSVPSDFEIVGNYFYKPDKWNSNSPEYKNISWCMKNLFELKNAQRLIVSGNIFENNWGICGGQRATGIVLTPRNQNGNANWSVVQDLIFTNNIVRNVGYAMRVLSNDDLHKSEITKRIEIKNNIFDFINNNYYTGYGIGFSSPYNNTPSYKISVKNNIFLHNYTGGSFMYLGFDSLRITHYSVIDNFTYENNIATHVNYGLFGDNMGVGNDAINHYLDNYSFRRNLLINRPIDRDYSYWINQFSNSYPKDNLMVHNLSDAGFTNYNQRNYRLTSSSPGKNNGTDGKDIGPDYDAIDYATRCTLNGQCYVSCTPSCSGKTCGSDGCSGSCGTCNNGETCNNGKCIKNNFNIAEPELPRYFIDTTYNLPNVGTTWRVKQGDNLQSIIDNAQLGDVIVLDSNATFIGNYKLPSKTGNGWIYIISSELDQLKEGNRVGPNDAIHMPKIIATPNTNLEAINAQFGSHNYRFAGINFISNSPLTVLVKLGYGNKDPNQALWNVSAADSVEKLPYNITIDRCIIQSTNDSAKLRIGVIGDGSYVSVIDSYITNVKDGPDAQAILIWNGPGPYKIVNNFLEGTGENFMSGGNDPAILNMVPADFEIRGNYFYKRLDWKEGHPRFNGYNWGVKNLFEIKNAKRLLVTGNIFDNSWIKKQMGYAVILKASNDGGNSNWSTFTDMVFKDNIIKNSVSGIAFSASEHPYGGTTEGIKRVVVKNNLIDFSDSINNLFTEFNTDFLVTFRGGGVIARDIIVDHNTMISNNNSKAMITAGDTPNQYENVRITNNILRRGTYGFKATGRSEGNSSVDYITNCNFINNLIFDINNIGIYPSNNFGTTDINNVGFIDYNNQNYRLSLSSSYKNKGSDGKDLGADIDTIEDATRCTLSGQCN